MQNLASEIGNAMRDLIARPEISVEQFMEASLEIGAEFLASGGPVTRVETQLNAAGVHWGYQVTVHATPSAISLFCYVPQQRESFSRARRIESFGVDLGRLRCADQILRRFAAGRTTPAHALVCVTRLHRHKRKPALLLNCLSALGIGAGAALLVGASTEEVLACGIFSAGIHWIADTVRRCLSVRPVFVEFLTCFLAFLFAAIFSPVMRIAPQLLSLGTLVYVVPGLLLTTAISEIVDQNYLSGTIRLLKALCSFMSMALAYYIAKDLGQSLGIPLPTTAGMMPSPSLAEQLLGSALIVLCSGVEFGVHRKLLVRLLICGLAGAAAHAILKSDGNFVLPAFVAAFVISMMSYWLSRRQNHPSQIYSVPSVLILAPGMLAFAGFGYGSSGHVDFPPLLRATLISLAIVFGLAAGRLPLRYKQTGLS